MFGTLTTQTKLRKHVNENVYYALLVIGGYCGKTHESHCEGTFCRYVEHFASLQIYYKVTLFVFFIRTI